MKKLASLATTALMSLFGLSAFADSQIPRPSRPDHGSLQEGAGRFMARATGVRVNAHGQTRGVSVSGIGSTQAEANHSALDRCHTVTQGRGCTLSR